MGRNPYSGQDFVQLVWGAALVMMGVAFFFRIPVIMEQVGQLDYLPSARWFLWIALYLMAIILLSGGAKKIYRFIKIREISD